MGCASSTCVSSVLNSSHSCEQISEQISEQKGPTLQRTEGVGKVVLVTGASSGIGLLAAKYFAKKGLRVVLTARRTNLLEDAVKEIAVAGGTAVACKLDVTKEDDHKAAFEFAEKTYSGVDYVFANAGYIGSVEKPLENKPVEELTRLSMINVQGMALSVKYGVASMRKNNPPGGSIVITSAGGSLTSPNHQRSPVAAGFIAYCMTKGATDVLARGLAAYEHEGIRGFGINPCVYETEMTTRDLADKLRIKLNEGAAVNPIFNNVQTPWMGYPEGTEKIGHVVLALFDGTSKYKPGDGILCDGDATWNAQVMYSEITSQENPGGMPAREVFLARMKDFKGDPYDISKLAKMPEKKTEQA